MHCQEHILDNLPKGVIFMRSLDCGYLERAFDTLSRVYFENSLPKVVITIQTSPTAHGYITVNKIWEGTNERYREINISAETINRPIENVMATLLHEMVHLFCMENNLLDTSKGGKYHNKTFKKEAEKRDLEISYADYIGYSVTKPTVRFIDVLKANGLYGDSIEHHRITGCRSSGGTSPKKSSTRKYTCPSCGISVRATKDVNIGCLDCGVVMVK